MSKSAQMLGAAAIGLLVSLPAMAQPMSYRIETPLQNVTASERYDHLLEVDANFRAYRMRKECNPIDFETGLRQDCVASFDQFEPVAAAQ